MKLYVMMKELDGVLSEFKVLPYGDVILEGRETPAVVNEEAKASIISHFERRGNDMVIDYEHQTLSGVQAPAAGWIKKLVDKGRDGLWAVVEWTDRAKEYLKNREYRYFSPVMWIREGDNVVVQIENVALTNYPRINNLEPIMAKLELESSCQGQKEEVVMLKKIREMLGLSVDAADDKVHEAVALVMLKNADLETKLAEAKAVKVVACKEVMEALGADEKATADDLVKAINGMKALETPAQKLAAKVQELEGKLAARECEDLVQEALKTGRTSPAELDEWGRDLAKTAPDQFRKIVLTRTAGSVVPLEKINHTPEKKGGATDEVQRTINTMLGITQEQYEKYGPKAAE
ncbi:MAG: hypothetical protein JW884_14220 [Deltaproteobacteria bacterium]|nr:hypothetical protein [Deltaproteobacteria bacterium]